MAFVIRTSALVCMEDNFLFVKEGKENKHYGKWNLPGGHLEEGENLFDAVRREVEEETGLVITVKGLLGIYATPGSRHYLDFVYQAECAGGTLRAQQGEILECAWMKENEIDKMEEASIFNYSKLKDLFSRNKTGKLMENAFINEVF